MHQKSITYYKNNLQKDEDTQKYNIINLFMNKYGLTR